jgi:transposase-like protein
MPELPDKRRSILLESMKLECPCCGHDDFSAISKRFTWLLGKRYICAKCEETFTTPNRVRFKRIQEISISRLGWSEDDGAYYVINK